MNESKTTAEQLLALGRRGQLEPAAVERGLRLIDHLPDQALWRQFINYALLGLGALFLISGIFFFFAFNWADLSRFAKFGLLEAAIVIATAFAHWGNLSKIAGKISLTVAALLVGALLAVYGQTYQTGADSYLLFLNWLLLITAWVLIAAFDVLWLIFFGLANLTLLLWGMQTGAVDEYGVMELLFALNALLLFGWEWASNRGLAWMQQRWLPRLLALAAFAWILIPTLILIFDWFGNALDQQQLHLIAPALYLFFLAFTLFFYTRQCRDLFMLTIAMFSLIVVVTALIGRALTDADVIFAFLGASLVVIVQAALAVTWLRRVAKGWEAQ